MNNITISEFKQWLTNLVVAKEGALPDIEDWKLIKEQLDRVSEFPQQDPVDFTDFCVDWVDWDAETIEIPSIFIPDEVSSFDIDEELADELARDLQRIIDDINDNG